MTCHLNYVVEKEPNMLNNLPILSQTSQNFCPFLLSSSISYFFKFIMIMMLLYQRTGCYQCRIYLQSVSTYVLHIHCLSNLRGYSSLHSLIITPVFYAYKCLTIAILKIMH